jgi:shikimate kinase
LITKNDLQLNPKNLDNLLNDKKVFLVGFMAAGKTTIGKKIANKLAFPFFDSDKELERKFNMNINSIFEKYGESHFRKIEERLVLEYINSSKYNNFIMSLGGGSFINEAIRMAINKNGLSIWLNTNIEIIYSRIKNTKNIRPLFKKFDTIKKLENLMTERSIYYSKADIKIDTIKNSKEKMANLILEKISNYYSI